MTARLILRILSEYGLNMIDRSRPSDDDDRTRMMLMIAADMCPPDSTVFTVRHARAAPRDLNICEQTGSFFYKYIFNFGQMHSVI